MLNSAAVPMKQVLLRHFPVYPVVAENGRLVEEHAFEITAQPSRMVGVDKEERIGTPIMRSLQLRHPWLQINLLTAFVAAAVVGVFQHTLDQMVILAIFLPVLAGQSGNTGCQALAVTLRGMTLGELEGTGAKHLVGKEARLGFFNGALVGITAGAGSRGRGSRWRCGSWALTPLLPRALSYYRYGRLLDGVVLVAGDVPADVGSSFGPIASSETPRRCGTKRPRSDGISTVSSAMIKVPSS